MWKTHQDEHFGAWGFLGAGWFGLAPEMVQWGLADLSRIIPAITDTRKNFSQGIYNIAHHEHQDVLNVMKWPPILRQLFWERHEEQVKLDRETKD